jgi:hypothetical protein
MSTVQFCYYMYEFLKWELVWYAGICGLFEKRLKDSNPNLRNITYDIADLYRYIEALTDMSALV